jgi:hypothetical protein
VQQGPLFIAGLERSGTSLIYALLASHSEIAMTRRTNLWTHFADQYGDLASDRNLDRCVGMMCRYKRLVKLQPDWDQLLDDFRSGDRSYPRLFALIEEQYAARSGKSRWGDKSLNTERYAEPILAAYPGARILHMMRDPRDRFASSRTRWGLRRGGIGAGTAEWRASARTGLRNEALHPAQYRIVRYEDLASRPIDTLVDICSFVDVAFEPGMLSMNGAPQFRAQGSNSSYGRREPGAISTTSIGRYRDVLAVRQIAFVQRLAGGEMQRLGYPIDDLDLATSQRVRFALTSFPFELSRMAAWRAREVVRDRRGRPVPDYRLVDAGHAS